MAPAKLRGAGAGNFQNTVDGINVGSSITNSMTAVRENARNKLEHTLDNAVDAMGDAMFNNTLVSGITSMFGEKEDGKRRKNGKRRRRNGKRRRV